MAARDIIVVGSSAGGVAALQRLCAALPADLPASVFVAQHLSPSAQSVLPQLLDRAGPLPALSPVDGQEFLPGHVYVAAPDMHMLLRPDRILMRRGPFENRTRPAVNVLFRSAAVHFGARVIGVVLTGLLDDGTEGLIAIKAAGGLSVVQDPADAEWPSMPRNALNRDHVDHAMPIEGMAELLVGLLNGDPGLTVPLPEGYLTEDRISAQEFAVAERGVVTPGEPSHMSCPDCGGVLNYIETEDETRFRCQVGHAFTPVGLADAQGDELERALAIAVRTHRDRIKLFSQMHEGALSRGLAHAGKRWDDAIVDAQHLIRVLEDAMITVRRSSVPDS